MAHFEIKNLCFSYPTAQGRESLKDVSLTIERGEYNVLCGKSGNDQCCASPQILSANLCAVELLAACDHCGLSVDEDHAAIQILAVDPTDRQPVQRFLHGGGFQPFLFDAGFDPQQTV